MVTVEAANCFEVCSTDTEKAMANFFVLSWKVQCLFIKRECFHYAIIVRKNSDSALLIYSIYFQKISTVFLLKLQKQYLLYKKIYKDRKTVFSSVRVKSDWYQCQVCYGLNLINNSISNSTHIVSIEFSTVTLFPEYKVSRLNLLQKHPVKRSKISRHILRMVTAK